MNEKTANLQLSKGAPKLKRNELFKGARKIEAQKLKARNLKGRKC